jgi:hypothetical protein
MGDDLIMPVPFRRKLSLAIVLAGCAPAMPATAAELSGPEIRELISGEKVRLSTPFGIALPLQYRQDPREEGRWWISGNSLCQKWPSWYDGRQFCFKITSLGANKIAWLRDDGASGTARIGP